MPQVPQAEGKGLLAEDTSTKPDATSILKAVSVMQQMGRLGPGRGSGESLRVGPRKAKGSKVPRSMMR